MKENADENWNLNVMNYEENEFHDLSLAELRSMIDEEWNRSFNGLIIDRDKNSKGQLLIFFFENAAYVAYEDYVNNEWWCSYDLDACLQRDWNEQIRLSPDDSQDYSFRKCSIISKSRALQIVTRYLDTCSIEDLYLSADDGTPILDLGEEKGTM